MLLLFILCALRSGSDRYYLMKTESTDVKAGEVFYFFSPAKVFPVLKFYLNYYARKLLHFLLCFFPVVLTAFFLFYYLKYSRASYYVSLVTVFAMLSFTVNGIVYFFRFNALLFLSRYYFASESFVSYRQLFSDSSLRVKGKRWLILKKKLSFSGWFISCILVFPVPFVQNCYRETIARLAKDLMEN